MSEARRKKARQQGERKQENDAGAVAPTPAQAPLLAADESENAAALVLPAVVPRPPARARRTSAAVKSALSVIADTPAPPEPAKAPVEASAPASKLKLVRTSFSLAKDDHATLGALKDACRAQGVGAKRSQLLRVAVGLLRELEPARLAQMVAALPPARKAK